MNDVKITFVIPCRNNLKYLRVCLDSIERHYGQFHDIIVLDDASSDSTATFMNDEYCPTHPNVSFMRNDSTERKGHTFLYDVGILLAKTEIVTILHSDMVISPNYVENMLRHYQPDTVVSATRIEPPLHPSGPEKIVENFGLEVEEFDANAFDEFAMKMSSVYDGLSTSGVFAPWMVSRELFFGVIGGHDGLFAPMELEDSDLFNRMFLAGVSLVQARDAFVYHFTCRGSRFKDGLLNVQEIQLGDGTTWYKPMDSEEYTTLRERKFREWWRKWKTNVHHDEFMLPIVTPRYRVAASVRNCTDTLLHLIEPWFDELVVDGEYIPYVMRESKLSEYSIQDKIHPVTNKKFVLDRYAYIVHIDGNSPLDISTLESIQSLIHNTLTSDSFHMESDIYTSKPQAAIIPITERVILQIMRIESSKDMIYPEFPQIPFLLWTNDDRLDYRIYQTS